ncbi:MAG: LicD family protein [Bacteroidaceae bacterium]|nr:LicD family protein [Bacteroidaceae bacterium]
MKVINIEEVKKIQLDILDDIANFCKENNLQYCLAYGTLLGAVRHKGYIPWDDDIDIHMPRADYEKFIKLYNSKEKKNAVITHEINRNYHVPFAKVFRKGTIVQEHLYKQSVFGVYVDIFPIDGIKSKAQAYICGQCIRCMYIKTSIFNNSQTIARKIRLFITKMLLLPFTEHFILSMIRKTSTLFNIDECEKVCSFGSRTALREILPKNLFESNISIKFEGNEYNIPAQYDIYLKSKYGDYMQLPPEENRVSTHDSVASWL